MYICALRRRERKTLRQSKSPSAPHRLPLIAVTSLSTTPASPSPWSATASDPNTSSNASPTNPTISPVCIARLCLANVRRDAVRVRDDAAYAARSVIS